MAGINFINECEYSPRLTFKNKQTKMIDELVEPTTKDIAKGMLVDIQTLEKRLLEKKLEYSKFCIEHGVLDISHVKYDDIINIACETFDIKRKQLLKVGRKAVICQPRQVLIYYLHRIFNDLRKDEQGNHKDGFMTQKEIGHIFSDKDHSTIIHAIRKVEAAIQQPQWNPFLNSFYVKLKDAIFEKIGIEVK
jgi:hypothetical protein